MEKIILTGATGAVGSELLFRLLERQDREVYCIIRPDIKNGLDPETRLRAITRNPRAIAVPGDITLPMCGVDPVTFSQVLKGHVHKFIHGAADVRFNEKFADEIQKANVDGTENVLQLCDYLHVPALYYVGTTYIAGDARMLAEEGPSQELIHGTPRNSYERTKITAEGLVRAWHDGTKTTILRPSIVVGHASDGVTRTFDGYYGFFKLLAELAKRLREKDLPNSGAIHLTSDGLLHLPIALRVDPSVRLNLIQSDWLADTMAKLIELPGMGQTYNLAHHHPMTVGEVIEASLPIIGVTGVTISSDAPALSKNKTLNNVQRMVDGGLGQYAPYVTHGPKFLCRNAPALLGNEFQEPPAVTAEFLQKTLQFAVTFWGTGELIQPSTPRDNVVPLSPSKKTA